jgi:hypothetical protein
MITRDRRRHRCRSGRRGASEMLLTLCRVRVVKDAERIAQLPEHL